MKKFNSKIALIMSIALIFSAFPATTYASGKAKLSAKKVTVEKGHKKTIILKNAKKKVKWKITKGKSVVKIKSYGKKKSRIKITGKKIGKATIKATCAGKKYTVKVVVKYIPAKAKPITQIQTTTKARETTKTKETTKSQDGDIITTPDEKETTSTPAEIGDNPTEPEQEETTTKRKPIYEEY